ncbi:MAG TPA: MFS transporter [Thermoanaerobaculia bacterium]|jgi:MFS family permease|nr:MFS transporter [Thermoanaerobaculia bacterium]
MTAEPDAASPGKPEIRGMTTFAVIWGGQVISALGSYLTGFALGVWIYQQTGSATLFALISLATTVPAILLSPFAGALVDRWDRRWAMIVSDGGAAAATLALALLIWRGRLEMWHIYVLMTVISSFSALSWPAFTAAITMLVPKRHLGRASGMTQMGDAGAQILSPLIAGALVVSIGRQGVVLIDFVSYLFAIAALLVVRIPRPVAKETTAAGTSLLQDARQGWSFIRQRPGLLSLLLLLAITNIGAGLIQVLLAPMVLSFASADLLGRVLTTAGFGVLAGGLLMSVWGGPRRRVAGILGFLLLEGLILPIGGLRQSILLIAAGAFVYMFTLPIINGASQALWQTKVEPDLQGRVFAVRRMVALSTLPIAYLVAGPLADHVFEPLLAAGGPLAGSVGRIIGVGKGRGIALMLIVIGLLTVVAVAIASRFPRLTRLESELPDALPDGA